MDRNYELNSKVKNILNVTQTAEVNTTKLNLSSEIKGIVHAETFEPYGNLIKKELYCEIQSDNKESEEVQEEKFDPISLPVDFGIDIEESQILENIKRELKIESSSTELFGNLVVDNLISGDISDNIVKKEPLQCENNITLPHNSHERVESSSTELSENIVVDNLISGDISDIIVKKEPLQCENNITLPHNSHERVDQLPPTTQAATATHNILDDRSDQVVQEPLQSKNCIELKKDNASEKQSVTECQILDQSIEKNQNISEPQRIHLGDKSKEKPTSGKKALEVRESTSEDLPSGLIGMMTKRQVHHKNGMDTPGKKSPQKEMKVDTEKISKLLGENITRAMSSTQSNFSIIIPKALKEDISTPNTKRILKPKLMTPKISTPKNMIPQIDESDFMKSCKECQGVFITVRSLVDHVIAQHEDYFVCDICGSHFQRKTTLRNHVSLHFDNNKEFKCKVCEFTTHSNSIYYAHKRKHFGSKIYKCNYCDFTAYYMSNIKYHERCHFARCQMKCPQCNYVTPYTASLTRHLLRHSEVRPYKCDKCPYSSKYPFTLESHKRKHSDVTLYNCEVCHKGFKWSYALTAHMFVHTNAKKFFCNKCDYSSGLLSSLKRHEVKHLNAMSCVNCPFTTSNFKNLICHRIRNHKVKNKYVCPLCDFTCTSLRKTLEHKSIHLIILKNKKIKKEKAIDH